MSLPKHIENELAKILLANILEFFETEEGQKMFENWKKQNENEKESCDD